MTDPVADLLARISNAARARHARVEVPASKLKERIVKILHEEGYIADYQRAEEKGKLPVLQVALKYGPDDQPVITRLKRVSKPGCRVYVGHHDIRPVLGGMGVNILSTPRGVMTGRDARRQGVGGEVLCEVW